MRTLRSLGDLAGKRVLVRVDFNVPLDRGVVADGGLAGRALEAGPGARAELELPVDLVAGDRLAADAQVRMLDGVEVPAEWLGLDIGERTANRYGVVIERAGTMFWNAPMGAFERAPFAAGTRAVEVLDGRGADEQVAAIGDVS